MSSHFSLTAIDSTGNSTFSSWFDWYALCYFCVDSNNVFLLIIESMSFRCLLKIINVISYCYHILISNIIIGNWGLVISLSFVYYFCVDSDISLLRQFRDQMILFRKRSMPYSCKHYLSISCLWVYSLAVL